ncbi:MAG: hypothetical protein V2B18_22575 [Pseudomonadota bacterium]
MGTPVRKSLPVKQLVADIRNGMSDAELSAKYGVAPAELGKLFDRLVNAGHLTPADLDHRKGSSDEDLNLDWDLPTSGTVSSSAPVEEQKANSSTTQHRARNLFRCPACDKPQFSEFQQCPQCGILVDKYIAKLEKQKRLREEKHRASQGRKRILALALISFLIVALAFGNRHVAGIAEQWVAAYIREEAARTKMPITYSGLSVSPLFGVVTLNAVASHSPTATWKIEELVIDGSRVHALKRLFGKAPVQSGNPFDLVHRTSVLGLSIDVPGASKNERLHLTARSLCFEGNGSPDKFSVSTSLEGLRVNAPTFSRHLPFPAEVCDKLSGLDGASVAVSYDKAAGTGRLDADIASPAFRGLFRGEALIVEGDPKKTSIKKAVLRVSILDSDLKTAMSAIERNLGRPLPREGDDIVVDVKEALEAMLGSGPHVGGSEMGRRFPGR